METYKTKFSNDELESILHSYSDEAEKILADKSKIGEIIEKVKKLIQKIRNVPVIGSVLDEVLTMIEMLGDYASGEYKEIPKRVLISIIAALLYMLCPFNLIPNCIPIIGYIDDVAIIKYILYFGAGKELEKYQCWKNDRE